jgi:hypothetical protein
VATTLTTLEAEFPAWHLLSCFDIFHLSGTSPAKKRGPETEESIETLAQAFGLDARELSRQYVATMHTALALQKKGGLENRAAWVEALKHFEGRAAMRKKYPTDALKEAGKCIFFHGLQATQMVNVSPFARFSSSSRFKL